MREIIVVPSLTETHEWLFARDLFTAFVGCSSRLKFSTAYFFFKTFLFKMYLLWDTLSVIKTFFYFLLTICKKKIMLVKCKKEKYTAERRSVCMNVPTQLLYKWYEFIVIIACCRVVSKMLCDATRRGAWYKICFAPRGENEPTSPRAFHMS